jgi:transcription termination/antitermination protein NusA
VKEVRTDEATGTAMVIVPDYQLSLAIGKEGQNARLAARLTGWRIDIKSETQVADEAKAPAAAAAAPPADEIAEPATDAEAELEVEVAEEVVADLAVEELAAEEAAVEAIDEVVAEEAEAPEGV